jgi:uncharacterized protein involved in exopolysaccharide biosynthesis
VKRIRALQTSMQDLIEVCARRKRAVFATAATLLLLSVLGCCFPLRKYTASSIIQVENASSNLQPEVTMLQSTNVARKVITDRNLERDLEENETFNPPFNPVYGALGLLAPRHSLSGEAGHPSVNAIRAFHANLRVRAESGARLLRVDYTHRDALVAAAVVNDLVKTVLDGRQQSRVEANRQLAQWLQSQLADLGKQSEELKTRAAAGETNTGRTAIELSQAQMNSMRKASAAQVARTGNAELIAQLGPALMENNPTPLLPLQNLLHRQQALQTRIDQDASQLGNGSPAVVQERVALKSLEQSLRAEVNRIRQQTQLDFEAASNTEQQVRATYEAQRTADEKRIGQGLEYSALSRQSNQSHELYQDLHGRLQQAGAPEVPNSSHVTITDQLSVSMPGKTVGPLHLVLGAMAGVLLACCASLLVESLGDKPRSPEKEAQRFESSYEATRKAVEQYRYQSRYGSPASQQTGSYGRWAHTQFTNNGWGGTQGLPDQPSSGMTVLTGRGGATKPSVTAARVARFGVINGRSEKRPATRTGAATDSSAAG